MYRSPAVLPAQRQPTILIVEDDTSLRELYQKVLTLEGYAIVAAEDGAEALRRANDQPVDAVILDLILPRLDGREVKRNFDASASMRDVPVILITGQVDLGFDLEGFACVLYKPIGIDTLVEAVRNCLQKADYP